MISPFPLNTKEQKDLEVYIKQFCYKSVQCIVTSRYGTTISTTSTPRSPSWFNVSLSDNPLVTEDCKTHFNLEEFFGHRTLSLTIELHNSQDDVMILEVWTFALERRFVQLKVTFTVYNALCLLLRSVITASRATPTYRLTRKQTTGGFFTIRYHLRMEEPRIPELGDSVQSKRIGVVGTPRGTVVANVFYRTSLDMGPSQRSCPSPVGDDGQEGLQRVRDTLEEEGHDPSGEEDILPFCPFADTNFNKLPDISTAFSGTEAQPSQQNDAPFASLLESAFPFTMTTGDEDKERTPVATRSRGETMGGSVTPTPAANIFTGRFQDTSDVVTSDSFVLIAPFASATADDVGSFYRECGSLPKLRIFTESSSSGAVNAAQVEQEVKEIEDFINGMSFAEQDLT